MRKSFIVWIFVFVSGLCILTAVHAEEQKWCPLCSMNLRSLLRSRHSCGSRNLDSGQALRNFRNDIPLPRTVSRRGGGKGFDGS